MKRWILVRARADLNQVRRPKGRGFITRSPVWVDTHEGYDFYAKLVRQGLLEKLDEADSRPVPTANPNAHPKADARLVQARTDLEETTTKIAELEKELEADPPKAKKKTLTEALGVLNKTHEGLVKEIKTLSEEE